MKYSESIPCDTIITKLQLLLAITPKNSAVLYDIDLSAYGKDPWRVSDDAIISIWISTLREMEAGIYDDVEEENNVRNYLGAVFFSANLLYKHLRGQ